LRRNLRKHISWLYKEHIQSKEEILFGENRLVKKKATQPGTALLVHETVIGILTGKQGKILDAGAGKGTLSKKLEEMGFEVLACDIDPSWFEAEGVKVTRTDLNQGLPYKDKLFDYVCCVEAIEHLWNPWGLIIEFYRVLRTGGYLIVTTPNVLTIFSRIRFLLSGRFIHFGEANFNKLGHITPIPLWQFKGMLKMIGFENIRITFNTGWIPLLERQIPIKNIFTGNILVLNCQKTLVQYELGN